MDRYKRPNKARLVATLRGGRADRVPNFEVLVAEPTLSYVLGRDIGWQHTLESLEPQDYIDFVNRIGQDAIGLSFYAEPFRRVDADGRLRPLDFQIHSREDLARVVTVDPGHLSAQFELLDRYQEAVRGTDVGLFVLLGAFFASAYHSIFGFENFMLLVHDDCGLIEEVLERHAAFYAELARRLVAYDLTFFYAGDDLAYKSGTLIDPELMRRMWVPRMARILEPAAEKGMPILFHSDGNITALIGDLLDIGVNAINPIEPYGMDIRQVRKRFGTRLCLVGNLDVGGALSTGTPEQVRAEARQLIDDVGRDGAFVLASCHSITSNVRPENFLAMVETARTYGVY